MWQKSIHHLDKDYLSDYVQMAIDNSSKNNLYN
jgi:hypothetical protein